MSDRLPPIQLPAPTPAPAPAPTPRPTPPPTPQAAPQPTARMAGDQTAFSGQTALVEAPHVDPLRDYPGQANRDLLELANETQSIDTIWYAGKPLSEAHNAHSTNTKEDMEDALKHGYNFFEGDIRTEMNPPHALEMRHDEGGEKGDNMTLEEWLTVGKESGRGLKLDVKEGERIGEMLDMLEKIGVPDERIMMNLGDGDMKKWGPEIRKRFPDAVLAVNPAKELDGKKNEGPLQDWQVDRMIELGEAGGAPVTFVVRYDLLTDSAIARLKEHGTVSVWNSPSEGGVGDPGKLADELRDRGVNGVIDLRKSMSNLDKAEKGIEKGVSWVKDWF